MFELPQSKADKNIAGVTPRGVSYTLRSVLRRYELPSTHTLRVSIYLNVGVSLSVFSLAVVGQNIEQADASTHSFYYVVSQEITNPFAQGVCGQLFIKR